MTGPTRYELAGDVGTVTLDDPERRNALSTALLNSLGDDLGTARDDPSCRIVVITNTGPAFCAGADLKSAGPRAGPGTVETPRHSLVGVLTAILECPKPVVGRIAGHCMGGGIGLAAACDISVVSDDARLGFTEVRVGVAPAIISVVCLPKLRRADALELFLTGDRVEASRAAELGLVNRAVPAEQLDEAVASVVDALRHGAPGALAAAKQLVREVPSMGREEAFAWTAELSARLFASPEAAEGMASFRERRPASWMPEPR